MGIDNSRLSQKCIRIQLLDNHELSMLERHGIIHGYLKSVFEYTFYITMNNINLFVNWQFMVISKVYSNTVFR